MIQEFSKGSKNIIFDIGANEGNDGLSFALLFKDCQIYAFEPNRDLVKVINFNKKRIEKIIGSQIKNYKLINKAISNRNTILNFNISKNIGAHSLYNFNKNLYQFKRHQKYYEVTKKIKVRVIKLSSFLKNKKFKRIKYLHCDAQGSDINVLKSLENFIKYLDCGVVEVSANKKRDLYSKSLNNLSNLKKFLKKKNFNIIDIKSNDPYRNELNINFKNSAINHYNFLNLKEKILLRFYQKFIRKIIIGHYKIFLYKFLYRILNATNK